MLQLHISSNLKIDPFANPYLNHIQINRTHHSRVQCSDSFTAQSVQSSTNIWLALTGLQSSQVLHARLHMELIEQHRGSCFLEIQKCLSPKLKTSVQARVISSSDVDNGCCIPTGFQAVRCCQVRLPYLNLILAVTHPVYLWEFWSSEKKFRRIIQARVYLVKCLEVSPGGGIRFFGWTMLFRTRRRPASRFRSLMILTVRLETENTGKNLGISETHRDLWLQELKIIRNSREN